MLDALADLEFEATLQVVARFAAGPTGAAQLMARMPGTDVAAIREDLAAVGEVLAIFRRGERVVAESAPDVQTALAHLRVEGSVLEPLDLRDIARLLAASRAVSAELQRVKDEAPRAAALRVALPDKAIDRRLAQSIAAAGELLDSASPALAAARREVHVTRQRLVRRLEGIMRGIDPDSDAGVTLRGGRYVIPVRRDSRSRPSGIVHDESASAGTLFIEPSEAVELGNAFREALSNEEREVLRVLRELSAMLRPAHAELVGAFSMCVAVDALVARARYAIEVKGEVPDMCEAGGPLVLHEARHPLLLAQGIAVVPFSLELGARERTLLLSGPNTGGKTVLLKTVPLVALLAQCGIVPPVGAGSSIPVFANVFTDIGDRQSLEQSLSTFSGHLAALRSILEGAGHGSLVLLDEVGSGTDPAEGAALASAILVELTRRGTLTLATTHLGALKSLAESTPGVVNGSLQFDTATLSPTYRFRKGVPGRSYGLSIARQLGLDPAVLADAESRVSSEERRLDALLARAEERERMLDARLEALDAHTLQQESLQARLALQEGSQAVREAGLRSREKDADRRARAEAKRYLLEARREVEDAIAAARAAQNADEAREARRRLESAANQLRDPEGATEAQGVLASMRPGVTPPALAAGARIRLPSGMLGDLLEVRSDGKLVVAVGSMRLVAETAGVEVMEGGAEQSRRARGPSLGGGGTEATLAAAERASSTEVDLRGLTGDEAEAAALAALDAAVLAELPFLRFIHGMGTGVVRDRVRRLLERDRRVARFEFAPRTQGGVGVTVAEFAT
jgi:DNA mismatch repair protein MutS2